MSKFCVLTLCIALISLVHSAQAEGVALINNPDLVINFVPKKISEKTTVPSKGEGSISKKEEEWNYPITIKNTSFKPFQELQLKYIIFYKEIRIGVKGEERLARKNGGTVIQQIPPNETVNFTTEKVLLKKEVLNGHYYFQNGAKPKAEDSIEGIWIRIYQSGKIVAESVFPSNLTNKEKWE